MKGSINATWEWINYEPASTQSLEIPQKVMYMVMYTTDSKGLLYDAAYRVQKCSAETHLLACLQTIYFLFKVCWAHVIKNKNHRGFIDLQRKGVGMEEEENRVL